MKGRRGSRDRRPFIYKPSRWVEVRGSNFKPKLNSHGRFVDQAMIPSFKSFPSQPPQQDSEVSAPSSKQEPSEKRRKRSKERVRDDDEQEKRRRKQKHKRKHRDRDYHFEEDERQEASSSSTTFFSDYKGSRSSAHGGGTDSIRVPKYNLVARTSFHSFVKYN